MKTTTAKSNKTTAAKTETLETSVLQQIIADTNKSNYFVYVVSAAKTTYTVPQKSTAMRIAQLASQQLHKSDEKVIFVKHGMQASDEQREANVIVKQEQALVTTGELIAVSK